MIVKLNVAPYGKLELEILPAVVHGVPLVLATVLDAPFVSPVRAGTAEAREFAQAIIAACEIADGARAAIEIPAVKS